MIFWFSAEIEADVADACRGPRNAIEDELNAELCQQDYGCGVKKWTFLPIILATPRNVYPEINRYDAEKKAAEFRLHLDHGSFKHASSLQQFQMLFQSLLLSIGRARDLQIPDFDVERFKSDVESIGAKRGWIGAEKN